MSFSNMNKADLRDAADFLKVKWEEEDSRAMIIEKIEANYEWREYKELLEAAETEEEPAVEPVVEEDEALPEPADDPLPEPEALDEKPEPESAPAPETGPPAVAGGNTENGVLVRYRGNNALFRVGKVEFTSSKPFGVVTAETAERLVRLYPDKFEEAEVEDVKEFYGR